MKNQFFLLVLLIAFLVGIFYAAPQALIWYNLKKANRSYVAVQITHHGDMNQVYMPKAKEVADGHFPPTDLHLDNKNLATIFPALPPLLFSPLLLLLKDTNAAYLAGNFIFAALIFILFYFLGLSILKNKIWSLFLALSGILTPMALHLPYAFRSLQNFLNIIVKNFYPLVQTPLHKLFFDRIDDPFLTYPIYILAILALFVFWRRPKILTAILAGVANGLLAYTYFHYWAYVMIAIGLFFFWSIINVKKDFQRFKMMLILIGALIVVLTPYAIQYYRFVNLPSAQDYIGRNGLEYGRFFRLSVLFDYLFYVLLTGLVFLVFFKKDRNRAILYFGFILAMFAVWNIQLVVGYVPHSDHWWKTVAPLIFIILFNIIYELAERYLPKKAVTAVLILLMALLVVKKVVNIGKFLSPTPQVLQDYSFDSDIVDSWRWINSNLEPEPKIISDSFITSFYLLSYTSARPLLPTGLNTLASNQEIGERFLAANKLFGVSKGVVEERLRANPKADSWQKYAYHEVFNLLKGAQHMFYNYFYKDKERAEYRFVSEDFAAQLTGRYDDIILDWKTVAADYVYNGPWEKQFSKSQFGQNKNLALLFQNNSVEIYKIIK